MSEIERTSEKISQHELGLFTAKARRAVGLGGEVSVRITFSRELQELNRRFRHKNQPTDVLSFPTLAGSGGDIAIAREIAANNARVLGHSLITELKILILHGLLHLAGYDHESDNGEMTVRESQLRRELGLPFGLIERTEGAHPVAKTRQGRGTHQANSKDVGAPSFSPSGERVGAELSRKPRGRRA